MRVSSLAVIFVVGVSAFAADAKWLDQVAPIIGPAEKKAYLAASEAERAKFEEVFWANKSITAPEYFQRLNYVDSTFGSGRTGSGANTDQGRVYLSIGPPNKVARHPSSRIFVPMEIWYYDVVPGVLDTEVRLIFFQKNSVGYLKLYSPGLDTIRALLLPEAATVHAFGPNDSTNESDMRNILRVPPSEDEVISAAANVATGVKYTGNEEVLAMIGSPQTMLNRPPRTGVTSRLLVARTKLDLFLSDSQYGGKQIDLQIQATAAHEIKVEILSEGLPVYENAVRLNFPKAQPVIYTHRLDLLSGSYHAVFTVDGKPNTYPIEVSGGRGMGDIFRADLSDTKDRRQTPFRFEGRQVTLNSRGSHAVVALPEPEKVPWMIRKGSAVVWRAVSEPAQIASVELPAGIPAGNYTIEAVTGSDSKSAEFQAGQSRDAEPDATAISFNANLAPLTRLAFIGHQWLVKGNVAEARRNLTASLAEGATDVAQIELARIDALTGNPDAARNRLKEILARNPDNFEALSVYAYVETRLQDYTAAAELYRRALAIQDSAALRAALDKLPHQ